MGNFKFAYPVSCQGGGFPGMKSRSAPISKKGHLTAKLPLRSIIPPKGRPEGHVTVTGKFLKGGKEKGKVITDNKGAATCNGSSPYSTKTK